MALPSVWQLLIPNLNGFTFLGIIIVTLSILALIYLPFFKKESLIGVILGLVVIFVPSAFEDVLASSEGLVTFLAVIFGVLLLVYVASDKRKKRRRR